MDDLIKEFLVESNENLDKLDQDFVTLEKTPDDKQLLSSIFRVIHTIKGTCGFLGFQHLEKVTHAGENLLSKLRDGALSLNPQITNALLAMVDAVRKMLAIIEKTETDGDEEYLELQECLKKLCQEVNAQQVSLPATAPTDDSSICVAVEEVNGIEKKIIIENTMPDGSEQAQNENNQTIGEHQSAVFTEEPIANPRATPQRSESTDTNKNHALTDTTIRVDIGLLDKLMNLVGELVLSRNQILQFTNKQSDSALQASSQRLNLITTELQENVMKTRMQPIYNVWSKFPRVVRDLAQALGKQVEVEMEGKETEIDKSIIESIKDPLTHLVRNTVDHGIETPAVRQERGKPAHGRLILKAYHEGGMVNIEISDDGAGIDIDRVKNKAIERGMYTAEQLARMKDNEIIGLIFKPGFSTAEKITNVSGRGVGMDVVKTNIEKIGGTLDVQSQFTIGTTIKIKIPLTLAIIPALIVTCAGDRFAIPQVSLVELVLLEEEQVKNSIELIQDVPVYRLRGNLLPLVYLDNVLKTQDEFHTPIEEKTSVSIVVLQANEQQFGLVVDTINDTQEIVVKPLSKLLKGITAFAGATIMGDGNVALILDALGLAQIANIFSASYESPVAGKITLNSDEQQNKQTLLLFKATAKGLMAVPLNLVSRLEEFKHEQIEYSGAQEVVQYRQQIMPLIRLSNILGDPEENIKDSATTKIQSLQIVVYSYQDHNIGLVVENILDIIEDIILPQQYISRHGVLGSAVINGKVTELIDVEAIIRKTLPSYFSLENHAKAVLGGN